MEDPVKFRVSEKQKVKQNSASTTPDNRAPDDHAPQQRFHSQYSGQLKSELLRQNTEARNAVQQVKVQLTTKLKYQIAQTYSRGDLDEDKTPNWNAKIMIDGVVVLNMYSNDVTCDKTGMFFNCSACILNVLAGIGTERVGLHAFLKFFLRASRSERTSSTEISQLLHLWVCARATSKHAHTWSAELWHVHKECVFQKTQSSTQ